MTKDPANFGGDQTTSTANSSPGSTSTFFFWSSNRWRNAMKSYRHGTIAVLSIAVASSVSASVLDINQPARTNGLYFDTGTTAARPAVGQSFVPSYPLLDRIDVNLVGPVSGLVPDINSTQFTVTVYAGGGSPGTDGPTGAALGSKTVDYNNLLDQGDPDSLDAFVFDSPIAVTPGNKYFLQVTMKDFSTNAVRAFLVGQNVNDPYSGGVNTVLEGTWQYHDGSDARDLQFRTYGSPIPEPTSAAVLLGLGGLLLRRR